MTQTVVWQPDGGVRVFRDGLLVAEAGPGEAQALVRGLPAEPAPVPAEVTMFQARAVLLQAGLFDAVNDAMFALGPKAVAFQAWEYANTMSRTGALVSAMAAQLGLTGAQVDDMFRAAAQIEA